MAIDIALLTINKQRINTYESREFSAYVKHISQVSREFLLTCICECVLHITRHSSLSQLAQKSVFARKQRMAEFSTAMTLGPGKSISLGNLP